MELKFDEKGLIPAVVQDIDTREVLMVAYMNEESLKKSLETGQTWFYSRSRNALWHKGETSGNIQEIVEIRYDCDADCLLIKVKQKGVACHTGNYSCFYRTLWEGKGEREDLEEVLAKLWQIILDRKQKLPEGSYTAKLFQKGIDKIAQKVGEEAVETVIASKNEDKGELIYEAADLVYHLLVLLAAKDISLSDIAEELKKRFK
ncbi:bifunctional phosphoribosyl-AMP cyclohydrolase/phosphoribosyl-ATP pyrophosphatase [Carboxydothermus islandicus]|uniref:Histidine biosynthesis bifunctional protein HisIE n=1 Tax=Carboxydothermus islandicus TaxID=661089 RepID=A0A1L8D4Z5_9THEO|nr:bifunctional phosphoribosyl-AMP cyclohydrolase/phosphoribosyl-ATP diphosphatase HisIE [Carboxydothermus islandicus]GAV26255.1 bifunctional phosphoribosyl-AMP cyclohydrolase/phosphoribosyl-ATP pyrophosphatase [Carboxydothermus islandicus]